MDQRRRAAVATTAFALLVPGTVAGVVPWWLADRRAHHSPGGARASGARANRWLGAGLVAAGTALLGDAFMRFVRAAGTPSPVYETERLVTSGPYRWTRNPQYVGVIAVVTGQGLLYRSPMVLAYGAALWAAFDQWIRVYEEPRLQRRFGDDYRAYTRSVPRWVGATRRA